MQQNRQLVRGFSQVPVGRELPIVNHAGGTPTVCFWLLGGSAGEPASACPPCPFIAVSVPSFVSFSPNKRHQPAFREPLPLPLQGLGDPLKGSTMAWNMEGGNHRRRKKSAPRLKSRCKGSGGILRAQWETPTAEPLGQPPSSSSELQDRATGQTIATKSELPSRRGAQSPLCQVPKGRGG